MSKIPAKELFPGLEPEEQGETISNPLNNRSIYVNGEELSVLHYIRGAYSIIQDVGGPTEKASKIFKEELGKGLEWMKEHNSKVYDVLDLKQYEDCL